MYVGLLPGREILCFAVTMRWEPIVFSNDYLFTLSNAMLKVSTKK